MPRYTYMVPKVSLPTSLTHGKVTLPLFAAKGSSCLGTLCFLGAAHKFHDDEARWKWRALHQRHHWSSSAAVTCSSSSRQLFFHSSIVCLSISQVPFQQIWNLYGEFFSLLLFLSGFGRRKWEKSKPRGTAYTRVSLLLLHHTTSVIMAHVNMTGIKIRVMRISSGGSSQCTFSEVQFEKNCLWIPVIKPSARGFGQKQLALLASRSVHWVKLS